MNQNIGDLKEIEEMTDQERLAELVGKEGHRDVVHKDVLGNVISRKTEPKSPQEVLGLAQELLLSASWTKKVGKAQASKPYYYVEWNLPVFPGKMKRTGDTLFEAEIRCAIAALERLREEEKK